MPPKCKTCSHDRQSEIDQMLLNGTPLRNIAERFGTTTTALHRHKQHISKILVKAQESVKIAKADTLLDHVKNLLEKAQQLTARAEEAGSLDTALRGIGQVRGVLELLAEVSGQLGRGTQIAIVNGQPMQPLQTLSNEQLEALLLKHGRPLPKLIEGATK